MKAEGRLCDGDFVFLPHCGFHDLNGHLNSAHAEVWKSTRQKDDSRYPTNRWDTAE